MSTVLKRRMAEQFYNAGYSLFQEGHYDQAIEELRRAEEMFRLLDARGQPFGHYLPNGVSGLANTLALKGRCYQKLGDFRKAITSYETSLINAKFEQKRPFRSFIKDISHDISLCYETELAKMDPLTLNPLLNRDPEIDISFRFPFSLKPELIPLARLFELKPDQQAGVKGFYERARKKDVDLRRIDKRSDEAAMKKMSIFVWGILLVLWIAYGLIVARALLSR